MNCLTIDALFWRIFTQRGTVDFQRLSIFHDGTDRFTKRVRPSEIAENRLDGVL